MAIGQCAAFTLNLPSLMPWTEMDWRVARLCHRDPASPRRLSERDGAADLPPHPATADTAAAADATTMGASVEYVPGEGERETLPFLELPLPVCQRLMPFPCGAAVEYVRGDGGDLRKLAAAAAVAVRRALSCLHCLPSIKTVPCLAMLWSSGRHLHAGLVGDRTGSRGRRPLPPPEHGRGGSAETGPGGSAARHWKGCEGKCTTRPAASRVRDLGVRGAATGEGVPGGCKGLRAAAEGVTLPLPCASTAIVAKKVPLPCASTAFAAKTLPLPCSSTAFAAKTLSLPCVLPQK